MCSVLNAIFTYIFITLVCAKQNSVSYSENNLISNFKRLKKPSMSEIIIESFNPYQAKLAAKEAQEAAESAHSNLVFARKQANLDATIAASSGRLALDPNDYFKSSATGFHQQFLTNQDKAESEAAKAALDAAKEAHAAALASQEQLILAKQQAEFAAASITNSAKYNKKTSEKAYAGKHKILIAKKKNKAKNKIRNKVSTASPPHLAALEISTASSTNLNTSPDYNN